MGVSWKKKMGICSMWEVGYYEIIGAVYEQKS